MFMINYYYENIDRCRAEEKKKQTNKYVYSLLVVLSNILTLSNKRTPVVADPEVVHGVRSNPFPSILNVLS